ncbi:MULTISPECIES: uroporphyrinogen decarboxylase [Pasteurellaceae]|uniref:Uroporphyrinogen decarboxylase n=1 Tax=Pasteurella atlantica TaxID=2827233 RepID=A0AAW8CMB6_9PAST|nr:uroporphyrinogen decarboxylase [Pasteurella atlantica]MBR0572711.1 uroporphyrinogen decarboxylase [Pasteurella atlantica]MDP8038656.1 uroporphyrinogen decarboxylase [Pasteurella atlantica]MDP8040748.1 uroporphyrinogen decarboxylase [Pasteurella atlantica]MDP8042883.1 uroporphyrinogen decarboxylase [Pasteurella atlantica]MDP8044970.1 uroporphyrinogen decarboxylase [Pasteurella atlantica]
MTELKNDRYLRALLREEVDMTPVWMMRQAGRYLPEYKETRSQAGDFMSLCRNTELACEVTLQPLRRYNLDAAILFSDILTVPDAMGLGLYFEAGEGQKFERPVQSKSDVEKLGVVDPEVELQYVMNAVRKIRQELKGDVPLIGFSGSPWTLATYMVEGGSSKAFTKIKKMLYSDPQTLHLLLAKLAENVTAYLNAQIKAGAQSVMIFDTWGGVLAHRDYQDFSLQYMHQIVNSLTRENEGRKVPVTLFTKGGGLWLEKIAETGCDAIGLDWTINLSDARARVGHKVALQGNMDPSVLYASPQRIEQEVKQILTDFGQGTGHIFNLGHGIHQDVPVESPKIFVDAIHQYSQPFHK